MPQELRIRASRRDAEPEGYSVRGGTFTGSTTRLPDTHGLIKRIDGLTRGGTIFSGNASSTGIILVDWKANVRKLAMLARLQEGWDYPESQPLSRAAEANYLEWLAGVAPDRMDDAEPMLTDEGHIRLEWRRDGYVRIAEIGPDSLYLAALAPDRGDDDAEEFETYELDVLNRFFLEGVIRP